MIGIWLAHVGTGNRADCKKAVGRLPEGRRETMGDFSFKPLTMQESGALLRHARITLAGAFADTPAGGLCAGRVGGPV
jgi:hypothetical protein